MNSGDVGRAPGGGGGGDNNYHQMNVDMNSNNPNMTTAQLQQQRPQDRRESLQSFLQPLNYASQRSSITSMTNLFTGQELLKMLDEDLNESSLGNPALQQQQQLMQQDLIRRASVASAGSGSQPQQHQTAHSQQQQESMMAATMIQHQQQQQQQQLQQNNVPLQLAQAQQNEQIEAFLQVHGHQLNHVQRANLEQQLLRNTAQLQPQYPFITLANSNNNMAVALGMQQQQQQLQQLQHHQRQLLSNGNQSNVVRQESPQLPQQPITQPQQHRHQQQEQQQHLEGGYGQQQPQKQGKGMENDVMIRQREQLRGLQSLLKTQNGDLNSFLGIQGLQPQDVQQVLHQQQLQQQSVQPHRPSSSSVIMQQLIQHQQQRNLQQKHPFQAIAAVQASAPQSQMSNQAASFLQDQDQKPSLIQQPQQQQVGSNRSRNASISPTPVSSGIQSQQAKRNPSSHEAQSLASADVIMSEITADAGMPRVVPVSITPSGTQGGVSDAALAYTKFALDAIIASLNSNNGSDNVDKVYTARDLSTCLGAWDLNVPSTNARRPRYETPSLDNNDKNADTAFNFYHERSCPILLDAKLSCGPVPFSVDDFGSCGLDESNDDGLPDVVGAVVLTYGADSKFTGGVGEEGVLTKAIIEFFFDPSIAVLGTAYEGEEVTDAVVVETEEHFFTQTCADGNKSALVTAALAALFQSESNASDSKASSDDGVYIPTIWSGNTEREYKYCLLSNLNEEGKEAESKRLCVAIQKKNSKYAGDRGPAKGVCRITLTLSPESVQAKKKQMAEESGKHYNNQTSSAVHRNISRNIRLLRPPKLTTVVSNNEAFDVDRPNKRMRQAPRRTSILQLIDPTLIAIGIRCKHELLLDDGEVGRVYVNGVLVADCNLKESNLITSTRAVISRIQNSDALPAHLLFGVDFTLPSHKELPNKSVVQREYGFLLMEALITPHQKADVVGNVLNRLIFGNTKETESDDDDDVNQAVESNIEFDTTSSPCLESIVLSSTKVDPVGIGAKSIGTKFRMQYGAEAFPCEIGTDEEHQLHKLLGAQKVAKLVPTRARNILRRGGYLGLDQMAAFLWRRGGSSWDGDHGDSARAAQAIEKSLQLLRKSSCESVTPNDIRFVSSKQLGPAGDSSKLRSWYDKKNRVYYISDAILFQEEAVLGDTKEQENSISEAIESAREAENSEQNDDKEHGKENSPDDEICQESNDKKTDIKYHHKGPDESKNSGPTPLSAVDAAYLLAFYIAKDHPDVTVLEKLIKSQR